MIDELSELRRAWVRKVRLRGFTTAELEAHHRDLARFRQGPLVNKPPERTIKAYRGKGTDYGAFDIPHGIEGMREREWQCR